MRRDVGTMQLDGDRVVVRRGKSPERIILLSEIASLDVSGGWIRILRKSNDDYSFARDMTKDQNAVLYRDRREADAVALAIRSAMTGPVNVVPDYARQLVTERLTTLDGTIVINTSDKTVQFGAEGGPLSGAVARVETAGAIRSRLSATRVAAVGIFALAWRKKVDDRELYITVDGPSFQFVARMDPKRGDEARKFAARITTLGKR